MNNETIKYNDHIFSLWRENYLDGSIERRYCIIQDFIRENRLKSDYQGREILELVQNADDQKSDSLEIKVVTIDSDPRIIITNKGSNTIPFSRDGFQSIMRPDLSSKQLVTGGFTEGETIGNKGLGFRAVLNWSSHIEIDSAGLHCDFDQKIAWKKWEEIKCKLEKDRGWDLLKNCLAVAKDKCPVSLLATPEVKTANSTPHSTSITIHFDQIYKGSILSQINDLRPNILFFVRNIKQISIIVDDNSPRIITCSDWVEKKRISSNVYISRCILSDEDSQNAWLKYNFQDEDSEIAIAWREDGCPVEKDERFFYSFFPTKVRLNLPCIVHANVDLDAARNSVLATARNKQIMFLAGKCLTHIAEYIAECKGNIGECDWQPYKMLFFSQDELQDPINNLSIGIKTTIEDAKIFPTVGGSYVAWNDSCCYCKELAIFLRKYNDFNYFKNHLLLGWEELSINKKDSIYLFSETILSFLQDVCELAQTDESRALKIYSEIIEVIVRLKKRECLLKINFLPDYDWNIITENTAYINCGQILRSAPDFLDIKYVNPHLVDFCCSEESAFKVNDNRDMVRRLRDICDVSASDISQMKERIINFSKNEQCKEPECFKKIIKCLYETFLKSVSSIGGSDGMGYDFWVLAENGLQYHANEVTLWDESRKTGLAAMLSENKEISSRWRLHGTLQTWSDYLNCSEDDAVAFFGNFIGISLGLPLQRVYCGDDKSYVQESISGTTLDAWDFSKHRLGERNCLPNNCFIINADIIPELVDPAKGIKGIIPFIKIIFEDKKCYDILISSPNQCYFQRIVRWQRFESSYMSYKLRSNSFMNPLKRYAIEEDFSAEGGQLINSSWIDNIPVEQRRLLLGKLGAAQSLKDMSVEDLYEMLSAFKESRGIQKFYQKVREALRSHIDSAKSQEERDDLEKRCAELAAEKLDMLFAHKGHSAPELVCRNEIYYWDNDILAKQLLDNLPKLAIGSRVGADSVVKLFGVKRLRHESIRVSSKIINQELTLAVRELLLTRRPYILAIRMPTLDENKISETVTSLKNLNVEIVSRCVYDFNNDIYSMNQGELIQVSHGHFIICADQKDLTSALKKPEFCMALGEMFCIQFKLTGSQIAGQFRNVLKNSVEEIDYYRERETSQFEWERILTVLGLSEEECSLWENVLQRPLVAEEKELLASEKTRPRCIERLTSKTLEDAVLAQTVLKEMNYEQVYSFLSWLPLQNYQWGNFVKSQLYKFFKLTLTDLRDKFLNSFAQLIHEHIKKNDSSKQIAYCSILQNYTQDSDEWISELAENFSETSPLISKNKLTKSFFKAIKDRYHIDLSSSNAKNDRAPEILPQYDSILCDVGVKATELDLDIQSLLFFADNADALREKLMPAVFIDDNERQEDISTETSVGVKHVDFEDVFSLDFQTESASLPVFKNQHKSRKHRHKGIRYASSQELQEKGANAEQLVILAMQEQPQRFINVKNWSSLSSTQGYADDSRHYDISYETPTGETRYLEIKATDDSSFIMSNLEYETATSVDFRDKYDLALVNIHSEKVYFYTAPFSKDSTFKDHIKLTPESWHIKIE